MIEEGTQKQLAKQEVNEVKYSSLQSRVSPHFICNILASINALSQMNRTQEAGKLSVLASRYLRKNLNSADKKTIILSEELASVTEYVQIHHSIYRAQFTFTNDVSPEAMRCLVPNMILQPQVENALSHGMANINLEEEDQIHSNGTIGRVHV